MPTESGNIYPVVTGQDLGSPSQQWDGFFQNVYISGNLNVSGSQTNHGFPMVNVMDYGADNGGGFYYNSSIANGSKILQTSIPTPTTGWGNVPSKGQRVVVAGAGVAGADLVTTITAINGNYLTLADAASISVSGRGAIWGNDSTAAIQAAVDAVQAVGGGTIFFPAGLYQVSTVNIAAAQGTRTGRVVFQGVGGGPTVRLVGIGADQSAMISAPASSSPVGIYSIGFDSFDYSTRRSIAFQILGGTRHEARDCNFGQVYEGIRATNTWLNSFTFNNFYGPSNAAIHFGPAGLGPVNATLVGWNEFGLYGTYGLLTDATGTGGSNGNYYCFNDFEGTVNTTQYDVVMNDSYSWFIGNRFEITGSSQPGYLTFYLKGVGNVVINSFLGGYTQIDGADNKFFFSEVGGPIINNAGSVFYGPTDPSLISGTGSYRIFGGATNPIYSSPFTAYEFVPGGVNDWANGHISVATTPIGLSTTDGANPPTPNQFGANAVLPAATILINRYAYLGGAQNFLFFYNKTNANAANPLQASDWLHGGHLFSKSYDEGSAAPVAGAWQVGDKRWNTNPSEAGSAGSKYVTVGWICTVAGSPGTWLPMRTLTGN